MTFYAASRDLAGSQIPVLNSGRRLGGRKRRNRQDAKGTGLRSVEGAGLEQGDRLFKRSQKTMLVDPNSRRHAGATALLLPILPLMELVVEQGHRREIDTRFGGDGLHDVGGVEQPVAVVTPGRNVIAKFG